MLFLHRGQSAAVPFFYYRVIIAEMYHTGVLVRALYENERKQQKTCSFCKKDYLQMRALCYPLNK
jgi:hypothetical protein